MKKYRKEVFLPREEFARANRLLDIWDMSRYYTDTYLSKVGATAGANELLCKAIFPDGTAAELRLCSNIYHYYVEPHIIPEAGDSIVANPNLISSHRLESGMEWEISYDGITYVVCLCCETEATVPTMRVVMPINTLADRCGYFFNSCYDNPNELDVNNGYNCSHCDAESCNGIGMCLAHSCPIAYCADAQDCHNAGLEHEEGEYMVVEIPKHEFNERVMWSLEKRPSAVLFEYPIDDALTTEDVQRVIEELYAADGFENIYHERMGILPVSLDGNFSSVFGFIVADVAEEFLDFALGATSPFGEEVLRVMNDVELENPDGVYSFCDVITKIIRN